MSEKIKKNNDRIEILTNKTIRDKLLAYFKIYSQNKSVNLPFSLTDLADYLAVNRSAMTRELKNLKEEGFIADFHKEQIDEHRSNLVVELKYVGGNGAIQEISVVSKPGRRVYSSSAKMPKVLNGLGIAIVSTPNGVMTDHKARLMNVGGEVLCKVI